MKKNIVILLMLTAALLCFVSCDDASGKSKITPISSNPETLKYIAKITMSSDTSPTSFANKVFYMKNESDCFYSTDSNSYIFKLYSDSECSSFTGNYYAINQANITDTNFYSVVTSNDFFWSSNYSSDTNWQLTSISVSSIFTISKGTYQFNATATDSAGTITLEIKKDISLHVAHIGA